MVLFLSWPHPYGNHILGQEEALLAEAFVNESPINNHAFVVFGLNGGQ